MDREEKERKQIKSYKSNALNMQEKIFKKCWDVTFKKKKKKILKLLIVLQRTNFALNNCTELHLFTAP